MRNSIFFALAVLLFACEPSSEVQTTTLSGTIINPKGDQVAIRYNDINVSDTLNELNAFMMSLDIVEPTEIRFSHGGEYAFFYLRPGDQLNFSLDTEEFDESLTFGGEGAEINSYKAAMVLMDDSLLSLRQMLVLPEDSFLMTLETVSDQKLGYFDEFGVKDEDFVIYTSKNDFWKSAYYKLLYADNHQSLANLESFEVSDGYYEFQKDIEMNDSTQMQYPSFKNYVESFLSRETQKASNDSEDSDVESYVERYTVQLNNYISDGKVREHLLYNLLKWYMPGMSDRQRTSLYKEFDGLGPDAAKKKEIAELLKGWQKLAKGKKAPGFRYGSIDGDTLSLEDFKGRVVYIDVWATWCGPCIAEHPYMEKLQEQFKDTDVVFLAVATDSTPEPWVKMVQEKNLGGIHVYAPGAWNASIMEDYLIKGIPRFILIDQEGNIVDADASRPSGNIGDQIESLLKAV